MEQASVPPHLIMTNPELAVNYNSGGGEVVVTVDVEA